MIARAATVSSLRLRASFLFAVAMLAAAALASPAQASFGIETFESQIEASPPVPPATQGPPATQAGSHPYALTTTIVFNHLEPTPAQKEQDLGVVPDGDPKNVEVNLPAGVVANPTATATRCPEAELEATGECPSSSQVGVVTIHLGILGGTEETDPVYNMATAAGQPAALGFKAVLGGIVVHILGKLRTGGDYGLSAEVPNLNQQVAFWANTVTVWGDPSSASHDIERGGPVQRTSRPFLTLPTSCGGPLTTTMTATSWQEPEALPAKAGATTSDPEGNPVAVSGCEKLAFDPRLTVTPTSHAADSPTGLDVELSVPQQESLTGLAEANLRRAVVTLPAGMSVSPSAANGGLGVCTPEQIALTSAAAPSCPESAKLATVQIETPLLETPLEGSVYLAQQGIAPFPQQPSNPFGSLLALYLVAQGKGVVIKVPGEVRLDPTTGQLTTQFGEDPAAEESDPAVKGHLLLPQIPFSRMKLHFFDGPRAALLTPPACGTYTATSSLTPYSAPESGPAATPSASFQITARCNGGGLAPALLAGTQKNQAGAFSPLTTTLSHPASGEPEQNTRVIQVRTPPGVAGMVSSVALCQEPQATQGTCGPASLIGHVTVGVGAAADPLYVTGQVFLTGPYNGAPFGLSIVVPALAGPFNLGTVNVRAAITIDPHTAALTVTSDPLPQILDGVPLKLRTVNVTIDREHFTFNPTSCNPASITATVSGTLGANITLTSRFQAADCAALHFTPKLTVTASGRTSRANGASLDAKVSFPAGAQGTQANIAMVKVELPRQLPSRLTTLQKACTAAVFDANPAACPAASIVGIAKASTPVLPATLSGPVYFVSHGGEAFPELQVVLQGDGVRVDLVGSTFISKKGITSSTFKSVPDVPVSSFELYLPQGRYSALAANGNLCTSKLAMPTTLLAQNGAEIHQSTPIAVSGCPRAKAGRKANRARHTRAARLDGRHHR